MIKLIETLLILMLFSCNGERKSINAKLYSNKANIQKINILTLSEPPNEFMEALTSGTLILNSKGCLKIGEYNIIWPYGFNIGTNNKAIYNEVGDIVVEVGNHVEFSGGECSDCPKEHIKKLTGITPTDKCNGNYWIVGEEIRVK